MIEITTHNPEQTRALGRCIGQQLMRGITLRLYGNLGSGKTCFVQGLARGLAVTDDYDITSPTYTLINEYPGRLPLFHIDLYRLGGSVDAETIGLWEIFGDDDAVAAVEWAERLPDEAWPDRNLKLDFTASNDQSRTIRIFGYGLETDNLIIETLKKFNPI